MATLIRRRSGPRPAPDAMTLTEHLGELRRRLVVSVVAFVVAAIVVYVFYPHVLGFFERPYCESLHKGGSCADLYVTTPLQGFGIRLNVTGYGGLVLASPVLLYQLWKFVTPGLKANEKKYAVPFVVATVVLFLFGAAVAYVTYEHALGFLASVTGAGIKQLYSVQSYLTLIMALMAIFGLTFQFPVILIALELANVITPAKLSKWRRPAIVIMVVFAAVITPSSDPFSMLALALPMLVFYEVSIPAGKLLRR
jgi:sec-independent protein translocase protein TatC